MDLATLGGVSGGAAVPAASAGQRPRILPGQTAGPTVAAQLGPTVFLVDDDPAVRRGVSRLLQSAGHRVESFSAPSDFFEQADLRAPGCLLLDLDLPGTNGLELQARLHEAGCRMPVVFVSGTADIPSSVRAMKAGAVDFLTKPVRDVELLAAVASAIEADRRRREELAEVAEIQRRLEQLTPREREVLEHLLTGALNKQIADALGTVEKTVKVHRARVMEKMQAGSIAELVLLAQRAGIRPGWSGAPPSPTSVAREARSTDASSVAG